MGLKLGAIFKIFCAPEPVEEPSDLDCVLRIDTRSLGWHVMLDRVLKSIDG
ncbi:hypothetical protein CCACVL1_11291 [Corchorus capsularis]|uniref:Uncharacterized protein n=1 Tax=Corchorus capsularis TaxID=210143 RepID=A0A1R3IM44_COCAP|nr:hypothetical protein CCACVL1_11291 [Corchorus capsularis]